MYLAGETRIGIIIRACDLCPGEVQKPFKDFQSKLKIYDMGYMKVGFAFFFFCWCFCFYSRKEIGAEGRIFSRIDGTLTILVTARVTIVLLARLTLLIYRER